MTDRFKQRWAVGLAFTPEELGLHAPHDALMLEYDQFMGAFRMQVSIDGYDERDLLMVLQRFKYQIDACIRRIEHDLTEKQARRVER